MTLMEARHIDQCVFWKSPKDSKDTHNSLHDAAANLQPGKMLVYAVGKHGSAAHERVMIAAMAVAASFGLALVQWPSSGPASHGRDWLYAMQKRGKAVTE